MAITAQILSAEDLLNKPKDGYRYELIEGVLRKMSPAGQKHGRIVATITASLVTHVRRNQLGSVYAAETGFLIQRNPDTVRAPDVAFISRKRLEAVGEVDGYWPGAPDLVVEVISPNDSNTQVEEKIFEWLRAGASVVIAINSRKRIATVYRSLTDITILTDQDCLDGKDIIPGWRLAMKDTF
ncbi:MAG: Uma2 family endonuclease [Gammaproteobacteria bacterium]